MIQLDISWQNSWRVSTGPSNWDACWVFIKFNVGGNWHHATLSANSAHHTPATNGVVTPAPDGKGVFIYSSVDMTGSANYSGTILRWDFADDAASGVTQALIDDEEVEICVFAIEMVYVPEGGFDLGDGATSTITGQFRRQDVNAPFQIASEGALTLGGADPGSLNNNNGTGMSGSSTNDFNNTTSQILPADFPKGYNAFYCMKYELTQFMYKEFLNKLTRVQQNNRTETDLAVGVTSVTNRYVQTNNANVIQRNGIRCDATIDANDPITFYCDFNNNGIGDEAEDGLDLACNRISWADQIAFLDWSGLRPFTELEYEKACRGNLSAVRHEYAWGASATPVRARTRFNSGEIDEYGEDNSGNKANAVYNDSFGSHGLYRVGSFGQGVNTRVATGASYYGIMELSGNLWEFTISTGNAIGRSFTGLHGDGILAANGDANVSNWPGNNAVGTGVRGAGYIQGTPRMRVSDRFDAATTLATRQFGSTYGCRGVRTAP